MPLAEIESAENGQEWYAFKFDIVYILVRNLLAGARIQFPVLRPEKGALFLFFTKHSSFSLTSRLNPSSYENVASSLHTEEHSMVIVMMFIHFRNVSIWIKVFTIFIAIFFSMQKSMNMHNFIVIDSLHLKHDAQFSLNAVLKNILCRPSSLMLRFISKFWWLIWFLCIIRYWFFQTD